MENDKPNLAGRLILPVVIIITALILAGAWKKTHMGRNSITVTGLAKKDFVSDLIVWEGGFSRKSATMKEAYSELKKDESAVRQYLVSKGINEKELVFSAVSIKKEFRRSKDKDGDQTEIFEGYVLTQEVRIESGDVDKIEKLSREVTDLIDMGVEFNSEKPQYYYRELSKLKIEMLSEATKDATLRAKSIAENAGAGLGNLNNADMGIFQITAQNSAEDYSYGGSFNTDSRNKTASITVHLEFAVN